jgi:hypothetical protein
MKIRAKGPIKHHPFYISEGDAITVPDEVGEMFVKNGWAINEETGEDNEPSQNPITLEINSAAHTQTDTRGGE